MSDRVVAKISSKALRHNFKALLKMNHGVPLLPMVKADAYGHGAVWAVNTLDSSKGVYGFGVATEEEGIEIRSKTKTKKPILIFSDLFTWNKNIQTKFKHYHLTPVFSHLAPLLEFLNSRCSIPFEVELNTGMNRLGLSFSDLKKFLDLKKKLKNTSSFGLFTHFAQAEHPHSTLHRKQEREFEFAVKYIAKEGVSAHFHTSNSAAIWMNQMKTWKRKKIPILFSRPGISLYGVRPTTQAKPSSLLRPVMSVSAKILWIENVKKGEKVGYNGIFKTKRQEKIATLSMGYADGLPRVLGKQKAPFSIRGKRVHLVGRVSMDLATLLVTPCKRIRLEDRAEFFGDFIDLWKQAELSHTNPYEILTKIGKRVKRFYV